MADTINFTKEDVAKQVIEELTTIQVREFARPEITVQTIDELYVNGRELRITHSHSNEKDSGVFQGVDSEIDVKLASDTTKLTIGAGSALTYGLQTTITNSFEMPIPTLGEGTKVIVVLEGSIANAGADVDVKIIPGTTTNYPTLRQEDLTSSESNIYQLELARGVIDSGTFTAIDKTQKPIIRKNIGEIIEQIDKSKLSLSDADKRYVGGMGLMEFYSVEDDNNSAGATLAGIILTYILPQTMKDHPTTISYTPETSLTNLQIALNDFMTETFGRSSSSGRWGFTLETTNNSSASANKLTITANSWGEEWICRMDNFSALEGLTTPNENLIRPAKLNVGSVLVDNLDSQPTDKTKTIELYNNPAGHKLGDGFNINLNLGDYQATDLAEITYNFYPFTADGVVSTTGSYDRTHKNLAKVSELDDGFYREKHTKFPGRLDQDCLKKYILNIAGVVTGRTTKQDDLDYGVLVSIWGKISDEAFYANELRKSRGVEKPTKTRRESLLENFPTIPTEKVGEQREIYLKDYKTAYDIYNLDSQAKADFLKLYNQQN